MRVTSSAFTDGQTIPRVHATRRGGGGNVSIPIEWHDGSEHVASFALAVVDREPRARDWVHWLVVGLPASVSSLPADASRSGLPSPATELVNTFGERGYDGPQPPAGTGRHPYEVIVYALDVERVDVRENPSFAEFESALSAHLLGKASVKGMLGAE